MKEDLRERDFRLYHVETKKKDQRTTSPKFLRVREEGRGPEDREPIRMEMDEEVEEVTLESSL